MAQAVIDIKAVDSTRAAFASVQRNLAKTEADVAKMTRSFAGVNIAKSLLGGLGIGSAFGVISTVSDKVVEAWKESAKYAAELEEKAKSISAAMQAVTQAKKESLLNTLIPEDQIKSKQVDLGILQKQVEELEAVRQKSLLALSFIAPQGEASNFNRRVMSYGGESFGETGMGGRDFYQMMQARAEAAQEASAKLRKEIQNTQAEIEKITVAEMRRISQAGADKAGEAIKARFAAEKLLMENRQKLEAAAVKLNEADEKSAEVYREMADPLREYKKQLEEIERIKSRLSDSEYKAARERIKSEMVDTSLKEFFGDMDKASASRIQYLSEQESRVRSELTDFFGDMDDSSRHRIDKINEATKKATKSAHELGWAFSSSFEDAILEGGKLRDILQGLAKDILRILIRNTITEPLAAGISGGIKGIFAGGKAQGGAVMPATTYLVGENGPELFTPSAAGRIIPNHNISSEGNAGGNNFTFNYSFPMGVTKAELIPALQATKAATIAAIKSMQVRSARAAFA